MNCLRCGKPLAASNKSGIHTKCMTSADKNARLFANYRKSTTGERGSPEQWREAFLNRFQPVKDDLAILGLESMPKTLQEAKKHYHKLLLEHHPDRGGDAEIAAEINAAFDRIIKQLEKLI